MPMYTYRNKNTGEEWEEFRHSSEDPNDIVNDEIELVFRLTTPQLSCYTKAMANRGKEFQDKVIDPKKPYIKDLK